MTKKQQTILLAVIGSVVMVAIAVVVVGIWAFRSMVENTEMDGPSAAKMMDDVRARFRHAPPVLDVRPGAVTLSRRPPDAKAAHELTTLHISRWDIHEQRLARVEVPFWLLRMKETPINVIVENEVGNTAEADGGTKVRTPLSVTVADIERFGPALLVDGDTPDGGHLLVWSD
jgi:hypothetical protein